MWYIANIITTVFVEFWPLIERESQLLQSGAVLKMYTKEWWHALVIHPNSDFHSFSRVAKHISNLHYQTHLEKKVCKYLLFILNWLSSLIAQPQKCTYQHVQPCNDARSLLQVLGTNITDGRKSTSKWIMLSPRLRDSENLRTGLVNGETHAARTI